MSRFRAAACSTAAQLPGSVDTRRHRERGQELPEGVPGPRIARACAAGILIGMSASSAPGGAPDPTPPDNAPGETSKPKILVADDTPSNIALLNLILGKEHEILCASNGQEAIEVARAEQPDLILLDALMPGMDGFETCTRLKDDARTVEIPVIFITSLDEATDEARALELGAVDFISKPISPVAVQARVRSALDLKRQRDLLGRLSFTDGLTGIANRRRFDSILDQEWKRAIRSRGPLSLCIIDVDHFKRFNDSVGHVAGDDSLRRIAVAAAGSLHRPGDLVARYGGEEFATVLPDTDADGALAVARRLHEAVAALRIPHPTSAVGPVVTVSIGVATAVPAPHGGPALLVEAADRALYRAKDLGRNRIEVATAGVPVT
jgi:diguanylate cyclase (GGDEF)-like protein